jgi:hypothetical protein
MIEVMTSCRIIGTMGTQAVVLAFGDALDEHEMDVALMARKPMMPFLNTGGIEKAKIYVAGA